MWGDWAETPREDRVGVEPCGAETRETHEWEAQRGELRVRREGLRKGCACVCVCVCVCVSLLGNGKQKGRVRGSGGHGPIPNSGKRRARWDGVQDSQIALREGSFTISRAEELQN